MLLGNKIKELRDKHEVLQRQLAAYLEIDTPMFSKIERGDRRAKRSDTIGKVFPYRRKGYAHSLACRQSIGCFGG